MSHLDRFVDAQQAVWASVCAELAAGAKRSHWMWFVFPQLRGLGRSATALHYGLEDLDEARDYAAHPVLGARLVRCAGLLLELPPSCTALGVFGSIDALKLGSCMTLFERAWPEEPAFGRVLERYHAGRRDPATLALLRGGSSG